jgi:3-phosphoglycerate kinase
LGQAIADLEAPFIAILSEGQRQDRSDQELLTKADQVLIGGGMANILKAEGIRSRSMVEDSIRYRPPAFS